MKVSIFVVMDKVSIDVRFGDGQTRPMRFAVSATGDAMITAIVEQNNLPPRSDYVLYLPPTSGSLGKWLARGELFSRCGTAKGGGFSVLTQSTDMWRRLGSRAGAVWSCGALHIRWWCTWRPTAIWCLRRFCTAFI